MKNICNQAPLYFYGELDEQQAAAFKAHLETCVACRKELDFLAQTQAALVSPSAPQDLVEKVLQKPHKAPFWQRIYKPVLASVLVMCLAVWGFMGRANVENTTDSEDWLAYVSEDLDEEYQNFLIDFELFEEEF